MPAWKAGAWKEGAWKGTAWAVTFVPPEPPTPEIRVGGAGPKKDRKWYRVGDRLYKATEAELRQILEALVVEEAEPDAAPALPDVPEKPAPRDESEPVRIQGAGLLSDEPAIPRLPDFSALMARQADAMVLAMMREVALKYLEDQEDDDWLLLH